ncbi:hemolysin family protein [Sphingomonas mucosissima]|uniref:Magnesium and cobalt efflux protein CorC n=1 Tax=Sphingomonas mucosissima TaxID=370959 RepID=A0A245ZJU3_9SPHN|nr:hemolysin family protein [Sphingomonas mucosissima]OWK30004.1 magnesium and cobalt efflux protein CorC [Sphingomonas mucosissima]
MLDNSALSTAILIGTPITTVVVPLGIIMLMVAINALYVAAEFATVGARKSRVQESAEAGNKTAGDLLAILRDPKRLDYYVAGCQVGITLSSLIAGAYGQAALTPILVPYLGAVGGQAAAVVVVLLLVTVLQVVLGELLPKTVALRYPERLSMATMVPMRISLLLFRPLIFVFNGTAFALMRLFRLHSDHSHMHIHSPDELEGLYRESAAGGLIDAEERDMLAGALSIDDKLVREIMTPRTRMATVAASETVGAALARVAELPYSRFPVTGEDADDITGIVHLRQLFTAAQSNASASVDTIRRDPLVVAELMTVPRLWETLRTAKRRSAIVINEYGSVAGLVTLEDALEEVFGELQDEFDEEEDPVIDRGDALSVRGDMSLSTLADRHRLSLPDDRADTIGGLVWHELGRLPAAGDEVVVQGTPYRLKVEAMDRHAVQRVLVIATAPDEEV